jgi:Putative esterase
MSLTGNGFLAVVVLIGLVAFVAVVRTWPRLAGAGAGQVASRVGLLLVTNAAVLLVVAVVLNNTYGFFADWTDLAGSLGGTQASSQAHGGALPGEAFGRDPLRRGTAVSPGDLPPLPVGQGAGGRVLSYRVHGPLSGVTAEVVVGLPASYRDPSAAAERFPVIETFSGYPGSLTQWVGGMDLPGALDAAAAHRQLGQAIVVSPSVEIPPGQDTECVDGAAGAAQVETWISQDVPNWVLHTFRALPDRRAWATMGLSAGAWCAAMASMLNPGRFGASVVMGGYFEPAFGGPAPWPAGSAPARRYDLVRLAGTHPPPVAMWLETSHKDRLSYPSSTRLIKAARPPFSVTAVVLASAGHRISLWRGLLPSALAWLGRDVPGFAPSAP